MVWRIRKIEKNKKIEWNDWKEEAKQGVRKINHKTYYSNDNLANTCKLSPYGRSVYMLSQNKTSS